MTTILHTNINNLIIIFYCKFSMSKYRLKFLLSHKVVQSRYHEKITSETPGQRPQIVREGQEKPQPWTTSLKESLQYPDLKLSISNR